jgi:hypothetical protein
MINMCPICGYYMEEPPDDYNICPSCGTEFGLHDVNNSITELQAAWLGVGPNGPVWWSQFDPPPANWNPLKQFERIVMNANPIAIEIPIFTVDMNPSALNWSPRRAIKRKRAQTHIASAEVLGQYSTLRVA